MAGRKPLPPGKGTILVNFRIKPTVNVHMKMVCFRNAVHGKRKFSEGRFISGRILDAQLPKLPTVEQIEEYCLLYPNERAKIMKLAALTSASAPEQDFLVADGDESKRG